MRLTIRCTLLLRDTPLPYKSIDIIQKFGEKGNKIFGLDGRTFDRRWIFLYGEGDNNYSIP